MRRILWCHLNYRPFNCRKFSPCLGNETNVTKKWILSDAEEGLWRWGERKSLATLDLHVFLLKLSLYKISHEKLFKKSLLNKDKESYFFFFLGVIFPLSASIELMCPINFMKIPGQNFYFTIWLLTKFLKRKPAQN